MDPSNDTRPPLNRRSFLYGTAAAAVGLAGASALSRSAAGASALQLGPSGDDDHAHHSGHFAVDRSGFRYAEGSRDYAALHLNSTVRVTRKSASQMTQREIDRFRKAFEWAVAKGYLDVFSDEHFDAMRNKHHGADVLAGAPPAVALGLTPEWGQRLLPWHRSFLIEGEMMLRAALYDRLGQERGDRAEANLLFLPYWDASHDQRLPKWVERMRPKGGTAIVPEDLPEGHAGFGKPVGSRYDIEFGRWPGGWLVFDKLPPPDQFGRILAHDTFADFLNGIDSLPEIIPSKLPEAKQSLIALAQKIPDDPNLQIILAFIDSPSPDAETLLDVFNAFLAIGHLACLEDVKRRPDRELIRLILSIYAAFRLPPHPVLHFWAGGLNPRNPNVRGTVTYFNELCVDPAFWMLHNELDRVWYTWSTTQEDLPDVDGEYAVFQPLLPEEGAWYGGGHTYQLAELVDRDALPYDFDRLFTV